MEAIIEFNFIYSKDAMKVKSYLGNVPRNIECINYMDIFNKLTKNDFYQFEPSDAVVSSYLMKQLQTVLDRSTTTSIFYVLGNLDELTIKGIKTYVESLTPNEIKYNIYHSPDINVNGSAKLFENVVEFE
tara:strand:- start:8678 stop:9067 length:390 start_codon:yes stop_codon:yes gene_type:complete